MGNDRFQRAKTCSARQLTGSVALQVECGISGNIVIRVLQYRSSGGGYLQLTFLNTIGGIDSVLISQTQADVSHHTLFS